VFCLTAQALAFTAQDAADCAAFSMGNWDFEEERFSKEDLSPEWKAQAGGFVLVSERLGFSRSAVNEAIRNKRGAYKNLVARFVGGDLDAEAPFDEIADVCDTIFDKAPKMKPYK